MENIINDKAIKEPIEANQVTKACADAKGCMLCTSENYCKHITNIDDIFSDKIRKLQKELDCIDEKYRYKIIEINDAIKKIPIEKRKTHLSSIISFIKDMEDIVKYSALAVSILCTSYIYFFYDNGNVENKNLVPTNPPIQTSVPNQSSADNASVNNASADNASVNNSESKKNKTQEIIGKIQVTIGVIKEIDGIKSEKKIKSKEDNHSDVTQEKNRQEKLIIQYNDTTKSQGMIKDLRPDPVLLQSDYFKYEATPPKQ